MLDETFYLDGVAASDFGIILQRPIWFSEPIPEIEDEPVPGRNGDVLFFGGSFLNRDAEAECYVLHENVSEKIGAINRFLLEKKGYRRLVSSDDESHFWLASVVNGAEIFYRSRRLNAFKIEFNCKPQRFLVDGERPISVSSGDVIYNDFGFPSNPVLRVSGNGAGTINIGSYNIDILSIGEKGLIIDSETMNAYNNDGNQNKNIMTTDFPKLNSGENSVFFDGGISSIEIVPRWWEL